MKIESWPCLTTHSACNCVLERLYRLEKEIKALRKVEEWAVIFESFTSDYNRDRLVEALNEYNKARQG